MQVIMPGNRACGAHAYRATTALHPATETKSDHCDQAVGGSSTSIAPLPPASAIENDNHSDNFGFGEAGNMAIDYNPIEPLLLSSSIGTSSSKRSHKTMSSESGVDPTNDTSHSAAGEQLIPAAKRQKSLKVGTRASKQPATAERPAKGITQATVVVGMQGSINRLTDIFERSMVPPPQLPQPPPQQPWERKERALTLVQQRDDGFAVEDKVTLISIFEENPTTIDTYLGLTDKEIRQAWISRSLAKKSV
jgi:hypothetical protein